MDERLESDGSEMEAYADRNLAVLALARAGMAAGLHAGVRAGSDPAWPLVCIDLPSGQVSWHVPRALVPTDFPIYNGLWDGHGLDEKRRRVQAYVIEADPSADPLAEERALFSRALALWGQEAELDVLIEEMAELTVAIVHWRRGRASWWDVVREAADVGIMLGQLREMPSGSIAGKAGGEPRSTDGGYREFRAVALDRLRVTLGAAEAAAARGR